MSIHMQEISTKRALSNDCLWDGRCFETCETLQNLEIFNGAGFSPQILDEMGFVVSINIQTCFSTSPGDPVSNTLSQH